MNDIFYVYVHRIKETGKVFYVGKGKGRRIEGVRNWKWRRIAKHHEILREIIFANLSEQVAFDWEQELIEIYKTYDGQYPDDCFACNLTLGGDGNSGYRWTEEQRARTSVITKAAFNRPEVRAKRSATAKELHSRPEYKAKRSASLKEAQNRPEVKAKKSASLKEVHTRPEVKAKHRASLNRPEYKAKRSASLKEAQNRPEVKAKKRAVSLGLNNPSAIKRLQKIYEKY